MVQIAPAARELTPPREIEVSPSVAVRVPPQVFVGAAAGAVVVVSTTKPEGRLSVKKRLASAVAGLGLFMVKVSNVVSPVKIGLAVKDLAITGGAITSIVSCAKPTFGVALVFGPLSVEVILALMLVYEPATTPLTFTDIVQLLLAVSVPPLRLMV